MTQRWTAIYIRGLFRNTGGKIDDIIHTSNKIDRECDEPVIGVSDKIDVEKKQIMAFSMTIQ